jgi:hypothetical protein
MQCNEYPNPIDTQNPIYKYIKAINIHCIKKSSIVEVCNNINKREAIGKLGFGTFKGTMKPFYFLENAL